MKEHLKECFRSFFIIVALINIAMFVLGTIFEPEMRFGYEAYLYPILYGILGSIPNLILKERKEPTVLQYLIHEGIMTAMCIAILLTFMFAGRPVTPEITLMACGVAASIVVIVIAVNLITWMLDTKTARDLTNELKAFQEKQE